MGIAKRVVGEPDIPSGESQVPVVDTYRGIVVNNKDENVSSMRAYLEGANWTIQEYYRQLIGADNDVRELDPNQDPAFQQYELIRDSMFKVQSQLATSYDSTKHITNVTGSSLVTVFVPNVNDYFVTDTGLRDRGIFRITNIERQTFNRDAAYRVDYELAYLVSENEDIEAALKQRVVRDLTFSLERVSSGLAPILTTQEHAETINLVQRYYELVEHHSNRFFNVTHDAMTIPGQPNVIYDAWLIDFIKKTIPLSDSKVYREMRKVSTDKERYLKQDNVFTLIMERNIAKLPYVHKEVQYIHKARFRGNIWIKGPSFWDIGYFVYPKNANTDVNCIDDPLPLEGDDITLTLSNPSMESLPNIPNNTSSLGGDVPIIYSIGYDSGYVLSMNFYNKTQSMSLLEILVRDYVSRSTVDLNKLGEVVSKYYGWPVLEQFYYGPILMVLIRSGMRGFF